MGGCGVDKGAGKMMTAIEAFTAHINCALINTDED